ncbi:hypothetical protein N7520_001399 [Penicillium odoratum]|uniref:uncharacterized protein n=1 Tax=Penicillium odoratum TaxID=1167516 RepID=UPI0025465892|nr:uncharacterized protein N7520_001399 [Penicillium odoratum]KAJ5778153.1 hypothetical protein N7520_001399 [Penicillium odoratum]
MTTFKRKVAAMNEPVDAPQEFITNSVFSRSTTDLGVKIRIFQSVQKAKSDAIVIEKIKGVISERSFNALLQWLYVEKAIPTSKETSEKISEILEFVRFADMCHMTGVDAEMADLITNTLRALPEKTSPGIYFDSILVEHIESVNMLPTGHAVRRAIARASVRSFLTADNVKHFKFTNDISRVPNFAADLLQEVQCILRACRFQRNSLCFDDPVDGSNVMVYRIGEKK